MARTWTRALAGTGALLALATAGAYVRTGSRLMSARFRKEVAALKLPCAPGAADGGADVVAPSDIAGLPEPARRYLTFMGVVGRPRTWSFRMRLTGRFRMQEGAGWKQVDAWQYNCRLGGATRVFHMRMPFYGVPVVGRDTYVRGAGRLLVRPVDLFTVEDNRGHELDVGELVTYLNDAILLAPSMLLGPETTWTAVDDRSFDVALSDAGRVVRARIVVNGDGAPVEFRTNDRFYQDRSQRPPRFVRTPWSTPAEGWRSVDGRMLPRIGRAVWHLEGRDFEYAAFEFDAAGIRFDVGPES